MKLTEFIKDHFLILDGAMGTLLQESGMQPGELPERWNLTRPEVITAIHRAYFDAGSHVVSTNTFGANCLKLEERELEAVIAAAVQNARLAAAQSTGKQPKWVALDIGPTGRMLKPYGDLDFEQAVAIFAKTARLGAQYGVDLIFIETMNDSYETKAAVLAAKEATDLPIFVSNAYGEDGKLMTGASPAAMVAMLEGLGVQAVGVNCSLGPKALAPVVRDYLKYACVPVLLKPNAGLPRVVQEQTVYDVSPEEFAAELGQLLREGVRIAGGCCGTAPAYIKAAADVAAGLTPKPIEPRSFTCVSSYTKAVFFGDAPVLIGERINPTGKKRFKEALRTRDMDYILKEGVAQEERGVQILDVNVGLPEINEVELLGDAVCELQAILDLPLQIDTADPVAMERAMRLYNGKPMVNSVNGKRESLEAVLPLVKKYGGVVVALTLDESGIPQSAEARVEIARRILAAAAEYGIDKKDIVFDPLALTVSADDNAARETLCAVERIGQELGCKTSLGVSNVSFGLPCRDIVNSAFFTLALGKGLSAAIMNPFSDEMMKAYFAYRALSGRDESCGAYIAFAQSLPQVAAPQGAPTPAAANAGEVRGESELQYAVIKGMRERAAQLTEVMVARQDPLAVVQEQIIPALNAVGVGFEEKRVYLPQLLMSAEAAKAAFEVVKRAMQGSRAANKGPLVLATVKGDVHDIGKNIVKLLLENYGFAVIDLGRDVAPERVVEQALASRATVVALSALMTTTVPAMEQTVQLLHERAPHCRIMVGGAVLTAEYAARIGADAYAKDAMEAVRCAERLEREACQK